MKRAGDYTRQHEAAERVALRRWLRSRGIEPCNDGQEPSHTELLMKQVFHAGGDPSALMAEACKRVDATPLRSTWPAVDHGLLGGSGHMSGRARTAALKREALRLFEGVR